MVSSSAVLLFASMSLLLTELKGPEPMNDVSVRSKLTPDAWE